MNIYEEAARRYGGGVFRFPDCPECDAGYLFVRHVSSFSRAAPSGYHCDNCKHRWPKLTHRQMAQAMYEAWGNDRAESERQAMDVKRAQRIVGAGVSIGFASEGVVPEDRDRFNEQLDLLASTSLADQVEADAVAKSDPKEIRMVCNDRLTAAIYCALHYQPEAMIPGEVRPVLTVTTADGKTRALILVDTTGGA